MAKPTKEELYYCYHILNMKQKEIQIKFEYADISRLLTFYNIPKKQKGIYRKLNTDIIIQRFKETREDKGEFYDYSQVHYVNSLTKIKIICPLHGEFYQYPLDHVKGHSGCKECAKIKASKTNIEKYGCITPLQNKDIKQKIKNTCLERYGVENPSQVPEIHQKKIETYLKNFGCEYGTQSSIVKEKARQTSLEKYGVEHPSQVPEIAQKSVKTRIKRNNYCHFDNSIECRDFIRTYIKQKGYLLDQCAFADKENSLYEWGYYIDGRWVLYDLVVFEKGFRGNKDKIIEILEYHGPFHYTEKDVLERGDNKATPWKKSKLTIKESYEIDKSKEKFAKSLTDKFTVIWPEHYHGEKLK